MLWNTILEFFALNTSTRSSRNWLPFSSDFFFTLLFLVLFLNLLSWFEFSDFLLPETQIVLLSLGRLNFRVNFVECFFHSKVSSGSVISHSLLFDNWLKRFRRLLVLFWNFVRFLFGSIFGAELMVVIQYIIEFEFGLLLLFILSLENIFFNGFTSHYSFSCSRFGLHWLYGGSCWLLAHPLSYFGDA